MIAMFIDDVAIVALAALGAAILQSVYVEWILHGLFSFCLHQTANKTLGHSNEMKQHNILNSLMAERGRYVPSLCS